MNDDSGKGYAVADSTIITGEGDDAITINRSVRMHTLSDAGDGENTITITGDVSNWDAADPIINGGKDKDAYSIWFNSESRYHSPIPRFNFLRKRAGRLRIVYLVGYDY